MNPKVDQYIGKIKSWQKETEAMRMILLDCGLDEEIKWGKPCYTSEGKNIVVIQGFKAYSALLFLKGYLVSDPKHILVKTGENTVIGRQARFTDVKDIVKVEPALKACIKNAIEVERSDAKPAPRKKAAKKKAAPKKKAPIRTASSRRG